MAVPPPRRWTHLWVLAVSLLITTGATVGFHQTVTRHDRERFRHAVAEAQEAIRSRLELYVAMLIAGRGVYEADPDISREEFGRFAAHLDLAERYPGIQGLGFARRVSGDELVLHEQMVRARGLPTYRVWPAGDRDVYFPIVEIEPMDRRNAVAIGYDMFSEPIRREAMERARDTGEPAASGRVTLVQEIDPDKQPGFLLYVPAYRGERNASVGARRAALIGFVYAPFRADDLFDMAFASTPRSVDIEVYDGPPIPANLLHRSAPTTPARYQTARPLEVAGRTWTIVYRSSDALEQTSTAWLTPTVAGIGLLVSLALFAFSRAQVHQRARAERLAADNARAVRARDDFLSIAGHELKTPLAALLLQIQGIERQAERGAFDADPASLRTRLARAVGHVGRLERLIGELLDVSRITTGRLTVEREPLDLAVVVREVVERMAEPARRAGCEVRVDAPPAPLDGAWDRLRLEQVVVNLLANAFKYGPGAPVDVTLGADDHRVRLTVRDRGIGVSPEDAERVFGRFERAVSERHYGGLGLGLWISRQIVEAHGGRIDVTTVEDGPGAAFVVELPRSPGHPEDHSG